MSLDVPNDYRKFPITHIAGIVGATALLALFAGKGCPDDAEFNGGSLGREFSQGSDEVNEHRLRFRGFFGGMDEDTAADEIPLVNVPDVITEHFRPIKALEECLTRDEDIVCFYPQGPGQMKCVSLQEGDHMPYLISDATPVFPFLGIDKPVDSSVFIESAASWMLNFGEKGIDEVYDFSLTDSANARTQLGLACGSARDKIHSLNLDPEVVCHPDQSEEECDDAISAAQTHGDFIRDALPMAGSLRLFLRDYTGNDFEEIDPTRFSFSDSSLADEGKDIRVQIDQISDPDSTFSLDALDQNSWTMSYSAQFRRDGIPFIVLASTPEELMEELKAPREDYLDPPPLP